MFLLGIVEMAFTDFTLFGGTVARTTLTLITDVRPPITDVICLKSCVDCVQRSSLTTNVWSTNLNLLQPKPDSSVRIIFLAMTYWVTCPGNLCESFCRIKKNRLVVGEKLNLKQNI